MQREEANQRLRILEEGENYFIISPDSQRQTGRVSDEDDKRQIHLLIVTKFKFLLRPPLMERQA